MQVKEIMNRRLIEVMKNDSIFVASGLMKQHGVRHLLVTDEDSRLVGVISDRDILRGFCEVSNTDGEMPPVERYMSRFPVCCGPDEDVQLAINKMIETDIHCIPIVDDKSSPLGIITSKDILHLYEKDARPVNH